MVLDGEDRRARCRWPAVLQRAAEPRAAEERAGDRSRAARGAGGAGVLRPAALGGPQPARRAVRGPPALPVAVPGCRAAPAAGARVRRRRAAVRRGAGAGFRGHRRQAARRRLLPRQALAGLAEGEGRPVRASSSSAATPAARARASRSARCCSATGRASACSTPGTSAPASTMRSSRSCSSAPPASRAKRSPFAAEPPLHRPTTWLKPEAGRRGGLQRMDPGRRAARAGVRAPAR